MKKIKSGFISFALCMGMCFGLCSCSQVDSNGINIIYSKDNGLYLNSNGKKTTLSKNMSQGGTYSYYYVGWGVEYNKDKSGLYFQSNVNEDGSFTLNYTDIETGKNTVISENVFSFKCEETNSVAYVKNAESGLGTLCINDGENEFELSDGISISEASYEFGENGNFIAYIKNEENHDNLYGYSLNDNLSQLICNDIVQFVMPDESDSIYYVQAATEHDYNVYKKTFSGDSQLLGERATALISMKNEKDILFMVNTKDEIEYSKFLIDDMAEKDSLIYEPNPDDFGGEESEEYSTALAEYESKLSRDEIRSLTQNETIYSSSDELYLYRNNEMQLIHENVVEAVSVDNDGNIIAYSVLNDFQPKNLNMSDYSNIDELMDAYYLQITNAKKDVYIKIGENEAQKIELDNVSINDLQISENGNMLLAFEYNEISGAGDLYSFEISDGVLGEAVKIGTNVYSAQISLDGQKVAFMTGYNGTTGTLNLYNNGSSEIVSETANNYRFGNDNDILYYTDEFNEESLLANLKKYENNESIQIDDSVFVIDYKNNGRLIYYKSYDTQNAVGELYLYDGKNSSVIDKNVSCMFFI